MVAAVISPPEGGSYTQTSRTEHTSFPGVVEEDKTYYTLSAIPAEGYRFLRWEWTEVTTINGSSQTQSRQDADPETTMNEWTDTWVDGLVDTKRITDLRLYFAGNGVIITVNALPVAAHSNRGSAEPPSQQATVPSGGSATFTVTANPASGFTFLGWKRGSAFVSRARVYTFTESATASKTVTLYAYFGNGKIIYASGGRIVFGSNGQPVFSG